MAENDLEAARKGNLAKSRGFCDFLPGYPYVQLSVFQNTFSLEDGNAVKSYQSQQPLPPKQ